MPAHYGLGMSSAWRAGRIGAATTTIFAEMSALAIATQSINLGKASQTPTARPSCSRRRALPSPAG